MNFMKLLRDFENKYKTKVEFFKLEFFKKIETFLLEKVYNTSL